MRPPLPAAPAVKPPVAKASKPSTESTVPAKRPLQNETSSVKMEATKPDEPQPEPSSAANSQTSSKPSSRATAPKQKGNLFSSFAKAKPKTKASAAAEPVRAITRAAFIIGLVSLTLTIGRTECRRWLVNSSGLFILS